MSNYGDTRGKMEMLAMRAIKREDLDNLFFQNGKTLHLKIKEDKGWSYLKGKVVGNYKHFINIEVETKQEKYIRSLNKVDLLRHDGIEIIKEVA